MSQKNTDTPPSAHLVSFIHVPSCLHPAEEPATVKLPSFNVRLPDRPCKPPRPAMLPIPAPTVTPFAFLDIPMILNSAGPFVCAGLLRFFFKLAMFPSIVLSGAKDPPRHLVSGLATPSLLLAPSR